MLPEIALEDLSIEELCQLRDSTVELMKDIMQEIFLRIGGNTPDSRSEMQRLYNAINNH
jgi:hypothetical protein